MEVILSAKHLNKTYDIGEVKVEAVKDIGGKQQRAAIARALVAQPDIVFADEPTGNLDQQSGRGVLELLKMMKEKWGQILLLVTHDMEIAQNTDRVIEIQDGVIVRKGA